MNAFQVYLMVKETERAVIAKSLENYYAVIGLDIEQSERDVTALITSGDIVVVDISCSLSEQYIKVIRSKTLHVGILILARENKDITKLSNELYDAVIFFPISQEELVGNIERLRARLGNS